MNDSSTPPPPHGPRGPHDTLPARLYRAVRKILEKMPGLPSVDQDDIAQEATLRALRSLPTYDPARGSFLAWLRTIVKRIAGRAMMRKRLRKEVACDNADEIAAH